MDSINQPLQAKTEDSETKEMISFLDHQEFKPTIAKENHLLEETVEAHGVCGSELEISLAIDDGISPEMPNATVKRKEGIGRSRVEEDRITVRNCYSLLFYPSSGTRARVYHFWPGKNVFFFHGRLVCGPDPRGFLLTTISIFLSEWMFCFYVCNNLSKHSVLIITFSVIINLIMVSTRDPGIVPRNEKTPLEEVGSSNGSRSKRISVAGIELKQKYCRICMIYRPPRSCHCIVCDNCVERFDHHCPWIGQCIGLRNYRYYMMFISSALVFFVYVSTFSWWRLGRKVSETGSGVLRTLTNAPETLALTLFSFTAIWFLGGLTTYHLYLITLNQTARERFKQRYAKSPNPYDKGLLSNVKEALFTRLPPSKVDFRAQVEPKSSFRFRTLENIDGVDEAETVPMQNPSSQKEESSQEKCEFEHLEEGTVRDQINETNV